MQNNVLQDISNVLLHLYEKAQHYPPHELQNVTLDDIKRLIPYDYAVLGGGLASERRITDLTVIGQSPTSMTQWVKVGHLDPFCDITLNQPGKIRQISDIANCQKNSAYSERWRFFDVADMMATISNEPEENFVSFLGLCRNPGSSPYTRQELQIKRAITPHVVQAFRINRQTHLLGRTTDDRGLALIDRQGLLKASRGTMNKIMHAAWKQARRVPQHVMKCLTESGVWHGETFQLKSRAVGPYLLVSEEGPQPAHDLTPREFEAAVLFGKGLTYKQVAREMGNSPATVRNQVSSVYRKLGVRNKSELAFLLGTNR